MIEATQTEGDVAVKPRFFSAAWFKNLGNALRFDKYDAERWLIWHLSSWATWAQVLGIKVVWTWLVNVMPASVVATVKSIGTALSAFFAGLAALLFS
jgi:hypothetical protein